MNYLITGGTGFIGKSFIEKIDTKIHKIIILSRTTHISKNNIHYIQSLTELNPEEKIDIIINLAGKPIDCYWSNQNKKAIIHSRVQITKEIIKLVERLQTKPQKLISASAIGYYGSHQNQILAENSLPKNSFTHTVCHQWEEEAKKITNFGTKICIVRLGVVLGKKSRFIQKITLPFKFFMGSYIGNGEHYFSRHLTKDRFCVMM